MKSTVFVATLLPLLASAFPTSVEKRETPKKFQLMSNIPRSPMDDLPIQARGHEFWLGGKPSTHCPDVVGDSCPPGTDTAIAYPSAMDAMVPGGQSLYVEPSGVVGYTIAHSGQVPEGSLTKGFEYIPSDDPKRGSYTFSGFGGEGFMACPGDDTRKTWQLFANINNATVPTGNVKDCEQIEAVATEYVRDTPAAWQYD